MKTLDVAGLHLPKDDVVVVPISLDFGNVLEDFSRMAPSVGHAINRGKYAAPFMGAANELKTELSAGPEERNPVRAERPVYCHIRQILVASASA
jgi:hypothetical protein